jgi:hypothetical protein
MVRMLTALLYKVALLSLFAPATDLHAREVVDLHDFHVSRLSINLKPAEKRVECTLATFVDDLELALQKYHQLPDYIAGDSLALSLENLNLTEPSEHPATDSLIQAYLAGNIKLSGDGSPQILGWHYLGKERDTDLYGMFLYFYLEDVTLTGKLDLQSSFMLDLYDDQQNVVIWKTNGQSADYDLLTKSSRSCDFTL